MTKEQLSSLFGGDGREIGDDYVDEDSMGYILKGTMIMEEGPSMPCSMAYYVVGGSSGVGYLYVVPSADTISGNDALERSLGHMMGCLTPADVKYAGLTAEILGGISSSTSSTGSTNYSSNLYNIPNVQRTLIVSMSGVAFHMEFKFSQGMATIYLRYASTKSTEEVLKTAAASLTRISETKGAEATEQEKYDAIIAAMTIDGSGGGTNSSGDQIDVTNQTAVSREFPYVATPAR